MLDRVLAEIDWFPPEARWWTAHLCLVHFLSDCSHESIAVSEIPAVLGDLSSGLVALDDGSELCGTGAPQRAVWGLLIELAADASSPPTEWSAKVVEERVGEILRLRSETGPR